MNDKGYTKEKLSTDAKLSTKTMYRMKNGKIKNNKGEEMNYMPNMRSIIAFCIACNLDMLMTITLLESLGLSFKKTDPVHYAYCYLIVNCRGESIDKCNEILKDLKIEEKYFLGG